MLPPISLQSNGSSATISAQGAQVLSWRTADLQEQLYLSPRSVMDGQAAIRGGVPVCFPQFNMRALEGRVLPKHGFARNHTWAVQERSPSRVRMSLISTEALRAMWPFEFAASLDVSLEPSGLRIGFEVSNTGLSRFPFAIALHTYLRVSHLEQAVLHGLQSCAFWDALANPKDMQVRHSEKQMLRLGAAMDRVYAQAPHKLLLDDGPRSLSITHSKSLPDTVVWNPGPVACAQLSDMPPDGWQQMLCVEAACIEQPVVLEPGQSWQGWQLIERA